MAHRRPERSKELEATTEMLSTSSAQCSRYKWLLSTWNMVSATKELCFNLILRNYNVNNHMWLLVIGLAFDFYVKSPEHAPNSKWSHCTNICHSF